MSSPESKLCLSRAEAEFALRAGDLVYHPPQQVHDFMGYSDDIAIFELDSSADYRAIDV